MMSRRALIVLSLSACGVPPLKLELAVSKAMDKSCGADACTGVHLACDAVASIRILDPAQPSAPYISQCQRIILDSKKDLCSLAGIDLRQDIALPEQTLEVQVVVYEASQIATDPVTGDLVCPTEKEGLGFDAATGFPTGTIAMVDPADPTKMLHPTPAIGGRAFWHPGDNSVMVDLACNDLGALNQASCAGTDLIAATATVDDFDIDTSVGPMIANTLTLRIGEPKLVPGSTDIDFALSPVDSAPLDRTVENSPAWGAAIGLTFESAACLEVLEDAPMSTATLTCKPSGPMVTSVDITGYRLAVPSLENILATIQTTTGTKYSLASGLTVGIIRDFDGNPSALHRIVATTPTGDHPTVDYVSQDGTTLNDATTGLGIQTSVSGIFLSRDAPFGTTFATADTNGGTIEHLGGLVDGKVTVVVFHLAKKPTTQ